ncbi:MAG: alpha/beta hydrolase [Cellulomonadaceae bacterium]
MSAGPWAPDPLGEGFSQRVIPLPDDGIGDGPLVATLVRYAARAHSANSADGTDGVQGVAPACRGLHRRAVLYVHGYNDYFFQRHLARQWDAHGYDFYALDLRRCGRSWRPGQLPHYVTDLREYSVELTEAARIVRQEEGYDMLVVNAHSTGGLTASLWAHSVRRKVVLDALVLNSPWFDLNAGWFSRTVATRLVDVLGGVDPDRILRDEPSGYARALHVGGGGPWDYDTALKSPEGVPARLGWLRAVRRGHARLARGLDIRVPVLVCVSETSGELSTQNPQADGRDVVLDVEQIVARAPGLGADVTVARIPGGAHDLALSGPDARAEYFQVVFEWLELRLGAA